MELAEILAWLAARSTPQDRENLVRFGINPPNALGVSIANIQKLAKQLGRDHTLAAALWDTGVYEARLLTSFVDEPAKIAPAQMDRWCRDFDNWGIVDTVCFHLFDRTPQAWAKVHQWSNEPGEFQKRAAFALLACLAGHDKKSPDESFLEALPLIEAAATDGRNFVKKGVNWALRGIGRHSPDCSVAATALAHKLADSKDPTARWIGKDALRDFAKVAARQAART